MNRVQEINRINELELSKGIAGAASWRHAPLYAGDVRMRPAARVPARPPEGGADVAATDRPEKPARRKARKSPQSSASESDAMKATATTEDTAAPTESATKESD